MKVAEKELYRGAALAQLVDSSAFRSIRRASRLGGHYEVNGERRILIRHSAAARGPWKFRLGEADLAPMRGDPADAMPFFLCLVCARETICILTREQVARTVDAERPDTQWIRVHVRRNASIQVTGSAGALAERIPNHAFPGRIFG